MGSDLMVLKSGHPFGHERAKTCEFAPIRMYRFVKDVEHPMLKVARLGRFDISLTVVNPGFPHFKHVEVVTLQ